MRTILLVGLILYSIAVRADVGDYTKCQHSTHVELSNKIPFLALLEETPEKINSAKKLIKLNIIYLLKVYKYIRMFSIMSNLSINVQ